MAEREDSVGIRGGHRRETPQDVGAGENVKRSSESDERKHKEDRRDDDRDFRDLFDNASDIVYATDLAGNFTFVNQAAERLTGYTRDEIAASSIVRIVAPEHLALIGRMTEHLVAGGGHATYEFDLVTKDGRRVPFEVSARLTHTDGRPTGVQGIARDITWRRRADEEVRRRAAHLEALNAIIAAADEAPDLPRLLEVAIDRALEVLGLGIGGIWVEGHHVVRGLSQDIGDVIIKTVRAGGSEAPASLSVEDWSGISRTGPAALAEAWSRVGIRASLTTPIFEGGRCVGVVALASARSRSWRLEEVALLEAIAQQLGATAEGLRLFREAQQRAELMGRLVVLSETLNRPSSVAGVVMAIGRAALNLSGAQGAAVYIRWPDANVTCPWADGVSSTYIAQVLAHEIALPWTSMMAGVERVWLDLTGGRKVQGVGPSLFSDISRLPEDDIVRRLAEQEGYRAIGTWPLAYEGRVIALVSCYYDRLYTWSESEKQILQTFTWQAAAALENARLYEAQAQRAAELEALYDLSSRLRAAHTPAEIYAILTEHTMRLLDADQGWLSLLDADGKSFTRVHASDKGLDTQEAALPAAGTIAGRVIQTGTPYVTENFAGEAQADLPPALHGEPRPLGPVAMVALHSERGVIGTMAIGRRRHGERRPFTEREVQLLKGIAEMGGTATRRATLFHNLEQAYIQMVLALARAMNARDAYTADHSERLTTWAEAVARVLGYPEVQDIRWAMLLHDIGKIGAPDGILRKPGPLTHEEWETMRQHPVVGERILLPVERMQGVAKIVRHHQEKWDGSGYPDGLSGEAIPLGARILAVIDAYGSITDERPYKKARSHAEAVEELTRWAGLQFDPRVVEVFCQVLEQERRGSDEARPRPVP